jgi:hypothetical protein
MVLPIRLCDRRICVCQSDIRMKAGATNYSLTLSLNTEIHTYTHKQHILNICIHISLHIRTYILFTSAPHSHTQGATTRPVVVEDSKQEAKSKLRLGNWKAPDPRQQLLEDAMQALRTHLPPVVVRCGMDPKAIKETITSSSQRVDGAAEDPADSNTRVNSCIITGACRV